MEHLDVFAVYGIPANGTLLSLPALKPHFKNVIIRHFFERGTVGGGGKTAGPGVPRWTHVNLAQEMFDKLDAAEIAALQAR